MKSAFVVFVVVLLYSSAAFCKQEPRSIAADDHIKLINFNPQAIHRYTGFYGYQSSILFESGETISTVSMGDSTGWQLVPQGNRLFIKPVADDADTNVTIITNRRVYYFELHAEEATGLDDPRLAYEVRFVYPSMEGSVDTGASAGSGGLLFPIYQTDVPDLSDPDVARKGLNFDYSVSHTAGSEDIVPLRVFDDGKFTYMQFSNVNGDLPSIFNVDSQGYESLVNFRVAGDYVIIERVSRALTLRYGSSTACVFNEKKAIISHVPATIAKK
ncbi:P-type conjugative transfer protein VirB9 [Candidatus Anaplasma sp. TIGMIC]|uniref:P-type conjugative transfer protein VirB9 n=1 Tax=Candidatus Anaplasma sp. TIGMIC TaxID=3020713 RepID=UPI00232EFEB2|nr:P-type conjugative transfer protein VirB9 [Candidatus Anaplasma sp. TIGMIC]MDB1135590.1 P-type conjugative transfer protein VirB9 [Candidatus Anaplasma sp. TIGMIC]